MDQFSGERSPLPPFRGRGRHLERHESHGHNPGSLAAFCLKRGLFDASPVREDPALLAEFRQTLREQGVTLSWSEVLGGQ